MSNPWCDRPIEIVPKEFALDWSIPESSVYEAIGKLKQKKIIDVRTGKVTLTWVNPEVEPDSKQTDTTLKSQNLPQDSVAAAETSETQQPEPPSDKDSDSSQINQTLSNPPEEEIDNSAIAEKLSNSRTSTMQSLAASLPKSVTEIA